MVDLKPTAIFQCTEDHVYTGSFGATKGRSYALKKGNNYYYAAYNGIVFLHNVKDPCKGMPWLRQEEFDGMVGKCLIDTGPPPV